MSLNCHQIMIFLVKDLKDYFLFDVGQFELHFNDFSMKEVVNDCYKIYEYKMNQKKLKFFLDIDPNIPDKWRNDKDRI